MVRFLTLSFLLLLVPVRGVAQAPVAPLSCQLPAGTWQKRQLAQQEFDRSGGSLTGALESINKLDARYRRFVFAVGEAYAQKRVERVNACCDGVRGDPEASMFCALVEYRLHGRRNPARFLAALPQTPEAAAALADLKRAASHGANVPALGGTPVFYVTDELFHLMLGSYPGSTATYFYLVNHSGGAYAGTVADELEHYLTQHQAALIRNWPVLRKYWNLSDGITWDVDAGWWKGTIRGFHGVCHPGGAHCKEVLSLLNQAARAAGTAQ